MPLEHAHSFLAYPAKHLDERPDISGTTLARRGKLYEMLGELFARAPDECDIEIMFRPDQNGHQQNRCRDLLLAYLATPGMVPGRRIADRLQEATTLRSGLGLLFLLAGRVRNRHQLVVARFPADQGIIAEEHARTLNVEFVERVFMRNARAYKCALYSTGAPGVGFWDGHAVDRQNYGPGELSLYWIHDFLLSDLRTTGAAGTKRLAVGLRDAIRRAPTVDVKRELLAAADLLRGQHGRRISARQAADNLGLSETAVNVLTEALPRADLMNDVFEFDREEFDRHAPYRVVELDNGAVLIAEDARFDEVFRQEFLRVAENHVRYVTEGAIVDERLRKSK